MQAARVEPPPVTRLTLRSSREASDATSRRDPGSGSRRSPASGLPTVDYFVGPENRLVANAVRRLCDGPIADVLAVALIGPPGCGKTTLSAAIASSWSDRHGEEPVLFVTGLDLRRQWERSLAIERKQPIAVARLEDRLAGLKLLVIEDLEGLANSAIVVEQLALVLDQLIDNGGMCLVTAGRPLSEIPGLSSRLVGRVATGLTLEVSPPAEATRIEQLVGELQRQGVRINPSAALEIAAWLPADARSVRSVARRLRDRFGKRETISRRQAQAFLLDASREGSSTPLAELVATVAKYYSLPVRQVRSSSRRAPIVLARAVAIYLARQLTPLSYDEIGRYLGGRDHTTVMHNYKRIDSRLSSDRALRSAIDDLHRRLGAPASRPVYGEPANG